MKMKVIKPKKDQPTAPVGTSRGDKIRFWTLLLLLAMSLVLAWLINSGLSETLTNQFN